jgi:hypothetical protein
MAYQSELSKLVAQQTRILSPVMVTILWHSALSRFRPDFPAPSNQVNMVWAPTATERLSASH